MKFLYDATLIFFGTLFFLNVIAALMEFFERPPKSPSRGPPRRRQGYFDL